jgi:hypothetical protein
MTGTRPGSLAREGMLAGGMAASVSSMLVWLGPPGNDLAAHVYQRALFLQHGFVFWNNFWYAGRYSFVTYSPLYYPLSAVLGIKVLAVASVATAAAAFAIVVGRQWGPAARWSSRTFGVVWAGTVLSAAFPFALGAALALLALWAVQSGHRWRFAALVLLTLAASPLAFVLLAVVLLGIWIATLPPWRQVALPAAVVGGVALVELLLVQLFPNSGHFPFRPLQLVPAAVFCALGAAVTSRRSRHLLGIYIVYGLSCVLVFLVTTPLGSNIERLRYAAIPLALLSAALAGWRPVRLAVPLLAVAAVWNTTPLIANYRHAAADPAGNPTYWQPAVQYLRDNLTPSYRVEAVDTLEHWPALFLPQAGIPLVRGWYRQNDFVTNELLYSKPLTARTYVRWLRSLGVRFVVLSDAPPDYSSRAEAALVRRGVPGLTLAFTAPNLQIYELHRPTPVFTGPAAASVRRVTPTRFVLRVASAGNYRLAVRYSPYWRTAQACISSTANGMLRLTTFRAGTVHLAFKLNVRRLAQVLTEQAPARSCPS